MLRFTIRDVLWLMVVVALSVGYWIQFQKADRVEGQRKPWETRAMQLKSQVERDSNASVKFYPDKTTVTVGELRKKVPPQSPASASNPSP